MKDLKLIAEEVKSKLPKLSDEHYVEDEYWKTYYTFCGFINDDYFDLCFFETNEGLIKIEIVHTTKNPDYFIKLIKGVEPKATINYSESETTIIHKTI